MATRSPPWKLEDLIDFEHQVATGAAVTPAQREVVATAAAGLAGAAARRAGLRAWLQASRGPSPGQRFVSALNLLAWLAAAVMGVAGFSAVVAMVDPTRHGIHVMWYLTVVLGGQWLVLLLAAGAWIARRRGAVGCGAARAMAGKLARRMAGDADAAWWRQLMDDSGPARQAVLWRLARVLQVAAVGFNAGLLTGLAALVLFRHVGFYWETSTELATQQLLENLTRALALPWSAWWPEAVPDAAVIADSRWLPDRGLEPGPGEWWRFLGMATWVWGLMPRLGLWVLAWRAGRRALARLDFQARAHRMLWRDLSGSARDALADKPSDGVLVLDVGGSGVDPQALRPFLLRRLRVHPASWHPVAVLDRAAEDRVARDLAMAPAGVVVVAEGWALSPARMKSLHQQLREQAGSSTPVMWLVANVGPDHQPAPATTDEQRVWSRLADDLRDPALEVHFYEPLEPAT